VKVIGAALAVGFTVTLAVGSVILIYAGSTRNESLWPALVLAGVCGIVSAGAVFVRYRDGESIADIWRTLRAFWDEFGI
jgi:hypothetical protein